MITKNGKQLKLNNQKNYRVLSGTVDNKNPKALYLSVSAWGKTVLDEDIDYNNVIRNISGKIKKTISKSVDPSLFHSDKCIVDFDMRQSGITYGKKSYMNCEITLFQKNMFKLQDESIQSELAKVSELITEGVLDNSIHFSFTKTKK